MLEETNKRANSLALFGSSKVPKVDVNSKNEKYSNKPEV